MLDIKFLNLIKDHISVSSLEFVKSQYMISDFIDYLPYIYYNF